MGGVGTVCFRRQDEQGRDGGLSELVSSRVDEAVIGLVEEARQEARQILTDKQDKLVKIAEHLQVVETMSGEELDAMLEQKDEMTLVW